VREQHGSVNVDSFPYKEFLMPPGTENCDRQGWVPEYYLGYGHPSLLPNCAKCNAFYTGSTPFARALELGHCFGLGHAGSLDRAGNFDVSGDEQALMGRSGTFSSFTVPVRDLLGFVRSDEVEDGASGQKYTLRSISQPPGHPDTGYMAVRVWCSLCLPKKPKDSLYKEDFRGGLLWISYRGKEQYSKITVSNEWSTLYRQKVYVHFARQPKSYVDFAPLGNEAFGTELWKILSTGDTYQLEYTGMWLLVCAIEEARGAQVVLGISEDHAMQSC